MITVLIYATRFVLGITLHTLCHKVCSHDCLLGKWCHVTESLQCPCRGSVSSGLIKLRTGEDGRVSADRCHLLLQWQEVVLLVIRVGDCWWDNMLARSVRHEYKSRACISSTTIKLLQRKRNVIIALTRSRWLWGLPVELLRLKWSPQVYRNIYLKQMLVTKNHYYLSDLLTVSPEKNGQTCNFLTICETSDLSCKISPKTKCHRYKPIRTINRSYDQRWLCKLCIFVIPTRP